MAKEIVEMLVEAVTTELPDTKTIRLKWPDGYDPDFKTGQFITVFWPDTPTYKRAYSLSSCALERGYYEVTVKRDGKMGTRIVDWVKPGDKLVVIPPVGRFLPVYEPDKHLVCIAGRSGVTPFRASRAKPRCEILKPGSPCFTACVRRATSFSASSSTSSPSKIPISIFTSPARELTTARLVRRRNGKAVAGASRRCGSWNTSTI